MNISGFLVAVFGRRAGSTQLATASDSGRADGRAAATAYCDGFLDEARSVFDERLKLFHSPIVEHVAEAPAKRLARKK